MMTTVLLGITPPTTNSPRKATEASSFLERTKNTEKQTKPNVSTADTSSQREQLALKKRAAHIAEQAVDAYVKAVPDGVEDLNKFLDNTETLVQNPTAAKKTWLKKAAENPLLGFAIGFGPQLADVVVPTLPTDIRPVAFDFTDWLFSTDKTDAAKKST